MFTCDRSRLAPDGPVEDFGSVAYGVGSVGATAEATLMRLLLEREGGLVATVSALEAVGESSTETERLILARAFWNHT